MCLAFLYIKNEAVFVLKMMEFLFFYMQAYLFQRCKIICFKMQKYLFKNVGVFVLNV